MGVSVTLKARCWPPPPELDKVGARFVIPRLSAMTTTPSAPQPLDAAIREHNALLAASGVALRLERRGHSDKHQVFQRESELQTPRFKVRDDR